MVLILKILPHATNKTQHNAVHSHFTYLAFTIDKPHDNSVYALNNVVSPGMTTDGSRNTPVCFCNSKLVQLVGNKLVYVCTFIYGLKLMQT